MEKKEFKAESKRLLDLMINSIYTHKEIFLRELISNASDALDKRYYKALTDEDISFNRDDFFIRIEIGNDARTLTITDTGIGMTRDELESNLGTIARSGSLDFKMENEPKEDIDIIGQFGVGFYSAFMVADSVTVRSRQADAQETWEWYSEGADGYVINEATDMEPGTVITIAMKENTEEDNFDDFLDPYQVKSLVRKYSDFIKYPIKMQTTSSVPSEEGDGSFNEVIEDETLNSMVPIWRKNKNELKTEDYENFYMDKRFGFEKPLRHIHVSVEGVISYTAILYIPAQAPYNFYTHEYEKGLELYSNSVMIMQKCADLLPDHFAFVQGLVDSPDFSLNISRELLQHDRQLKLIAKRIERDVKNELVKLMDEERDAYEEFFESFGRQLKYGAYAEWGANKETLQDLLLFYSSTEKKLSSLKEYVSRMKEDQKAIYYASGETVDKLSRLPQAERLSDEGFEILYLTDEVDEFAIRVLGEYEEKPFKNVSEGNFDLGQDDKPEETDEQKDIFAAIKEELGDKINGVRASVRLKSHPVCIVTEGGLSVEMEKVLAQMPDSTGVKADKFLEINTSHPVYATLEAAFSAGASTSKFAAIARVLYSQALLIEGLPIEDPIAFANDIWAISV
ncbi:MAG: molecular chaperone HtpG [Eubacteriaceae bacterium]|nr:molecular chaperone HtpG [Eubacteriaceae bacterium]